MNWLYGLTDKTAASWGDRNVYGILSIYSDGHLIYKLSIWVQIGSAILFCVSLMHLQMILLTLSLSSSATKNLFYTSQVYPNMLSMQLSSHIWRGDNYIIKLRIQGMEILMFCMDSYRSLIKCIVTGWRFYSMFE